MTYDYIFIGGGLAGKLGALYLSYLNPHKKIALIEKSPNLPENHIWSCFASDVPKDLQEFSSQLPWIYWEQHEVLFSSFRRTINLGYQSLLENKLNDVLQSSKKINLYLGYECDVAQGILTHGDSISVMLRSKIKNESEDFQHGDIHFERKTIWAKQVFLSTGWGPMETPQGYQKFIGIKFKTKFPHGVKYPIIMDATVEQIDGYRFYYLLPFSHNELLIEETYYSNSSLLDPALLRSHIFDYAEKKGWQIENIIYEELGILPIPLIKPLRNQSKNKKIIYWGSCGLGFHPVTGYTLPYLFRQLRNLKATKDLSFIFSRVLRYPQWPYYLLNHFMFLGAESQHRERVFAFFYRKTSSSLIARFYSGRMRLIDWIVFYCSFPPPIALTKALKVMIRFFLCSGKF